MPAYGQWPSAGGQGDWGAAGRGQGAWKQASDDAPRDRISVHLLWESVLLLVTIGLLVGTATMTAHQNVTVALGQAGYLGLVAAGLAFSLRTGTPNLAVGAILSFTTMFAGYLIVDHHWGKAAAFILAIVLATLIGFVLGVLVAVSSVPSWALTFGAAVAVQSVTLAFTELPFIRVSLGHGYPTALWFGVFVVVSAGGGALWLLPGVRGPLSGARTSGDPARWAGLRPGLGAIAGLTGSSFLAALAGIPLVMYRQSAGILNGTSMTAVAFAAVLLGGVSVYGRRAGVFGTVLGVTMLAVVQTLVAYNDGPIWLTTFVVGLVAVVGVGVSRAIESVTDAMTRPRTPAYTPPRSPALPPAP